MYKEAAITVVLSFFIFASPVFASEDGEIDVIHYDMNVHVSPSDHRFDVSAKILLKAAKDGTKSIDFSLNEDLQITSITGEGKALDYTRDENDLKVFLDSPLATGEEIELTFKHFGIADIEPEWGESVWGYIGDEGSYMIYEGSWYPMIWSDRATATIRLRVPPGQTGLSVGGLVDVVNGAEYTEFTWDVNNPTRGISFAAGEYSAKTMFFGYRPVTVYAYPEDIEGTELILKASENILDYYSKTFNEYPYEDLKIIEIPDFFRGGHGDQGMIMLYSDMFKKEQSTGFLAHEIAHNWWGAQVSAIGEHSLRSGEGLGIFSKVEEKGPQVREDHNLWLLEGFATYSSIMYTESAGGKNDMLAYLDAVKGEYLSKIKTHEDEPIINAEEEYGRTGLYHAVVYSKGAMVLHMLRYVVGDEPFHKIMNTYAERYRGRSATVSDFQTLSEEISGTGLDWFFDEWVRDTTLPDYTVEDVSVTKSSPYVVDFKISQIGDIATMPVEVTLQTKDSVMTKRVWVNKETRDVSFITGSQPVYIEVDRDQWILESDKSNNIHVINSSPSIATVKLWLSEISKKLT